MSRAFHRVPSLLLLLLGTIAAGQAARAADDDKPSKPAKEESWQIILMSGQRIGYGRTLIEPFERDGEQLVRGVVETHMTIKRFKQTLRIGTSLLTEESEAGDVRKFSFEMSNPPAGTQRTIGTIKDDKLTLESEIAGRKTTSTKDWDPKNKSPIYQDRLLKAQPLKPGETKSFDAYLPEFGKVATIKIVADQEETITLLDKSEAKALKVRITQSMVPGMVVNGWVDAKGDTIKSTTSMLGTDMVTYTVSREEALKSIDAQELDLAVSTLIKVKPIAGIHDRKEITYRIHIPDQDPLEFLSKDDVQTVKKIDDHTAELTVRALPIPAPSTEAKSPGKEYLQPSEFLQSDDEKVRQHADAAAKDAQDPAQIARQMEKYVRDKLEKKNFSTALASAAEVADKMEGDCTEHAVLLAAMLRAKQIPSRVAVGIVYVELNKQPSFGGHMWTEAYLNGKWVPLDGTLGRGGTGAGHIKMGESAFSSEDTTAVGAFAPLMLAIGHMQISVKE